MGRKWPFLKSSDLKGMTFNSICLIPLLHEFRKSNKVVPERFFFFVFFLEKTNSMSKHTVLVGQTRKVEGRTFFF